jgi:hypothetical protein
VSRGGVHWVTGGLNDNGVAHAITDWPRPNKTFHTACGNSITDATERVFRKRCAQCIRALKKAVEQEPPTRIRVEVTVAFECNVDDEQRQIATIQNLMDRKPTVSNVDISGATVTAVDPATA